MRKAIGYAILVITLGALIGCMFWAIVIEDGFWVAFAVFGSTFFFLALIILGAYLIEE